MALEFASATVRNSPVISHEDPDVSAANDLAQATRTRSNQPRHLP